MPLNVRPCVLVALLCELAASAASMGQESTPGDELGQHIATMKLQAEDVSLPIGKRESVMLSIAEALDRAARTATNLDEKEKHWKLAVELLDAFDTANGGHPRTVEFQLQSAVYCWAQGQSAREALRRNPIDNGLRDRAKAGLDNSLARLKAIRRLNLDKAIEDNLRFRLARALADRSELEPPESGTRQAQVEEGLQILKDPVSSPSLKGFAGLLRADLLRRAKRLDEALSELAAATKTDPPPPDRDSYEVLVPILLDQGRFDEAAATVKASRLEAAEKSLELFRIALARVLRAPPGDERLKLERELFRQAGEQSKSRSDESRLALLALAASGLEPDARLDPSAWDTLAQAVELRGETDRAAVFEERAASRAEELKQPELAASYRLRAGGLLFQAGKFAEADAALSRVVADPAAGDRRAKAGMLRAMARGRALAAGAPGITATGYAQSLQEQIRDFPKERSTDEARWLLGLLLRASRETSKALTLWAEIPNDSPRWLDARLAAFELKRVDLEGLLVTGDRHAQAEAYLKIQDQLAASLTQARSDNEQLELGLAEARLNLIPVVGKPRLARQDCDRLVDKPTTALQRYRLRLLRMISLVHLGPPFIEAEREAQSHATWAERTGHAALFDAVRLLDLCAALADADLRQRRFGVVSRILLRSVFQEEEDSSWTPEELSELRVRLARACLFLGDDRGAREALRAWTGPPRHASDGFLRDIADTYSRLEAYELAIDVQRMRAKNLAPGTPAWFDARYGLALAYFHSGQHKSAAQLIDATAILHPDLGGGAIQKKLIRLRQRIGQQP